MSGNRREVAPPSGAAGGASNGWRPGPTPAEPNLSSHTATDITCPPSSPPPLACMHHQLPCPPAARRWAGRACAFLSIAATLLFNA